MGFRKRDALTGKPLPYLLNTRTFMNHTLYAPYVYLPIACAFCWLAALLAMMGLWVAAGKPRYKYDEPSTVYISNVAGVHKWVFVPLCACVAGFYVASLLAERALRSADHLPTDVRRRTVVFGWLAIIFSAFGGAALILLGVFDCFSHSTVHWSMACVFIVCVALSAIFQTGQVWSLHKDHPHRKSLWRNSLWKCLFVTVAVLGAIAFAACYGVCRGNSTARGSRSAHQCDLVSSAAAGLEWSIAFILFFYFLTLAGDMWPASKYSRRYQRKLATWREKQGWGSPGAPGMALGAAHSEPLDQWETVQPVDGEYAAGAYGKEGVRGAEGGRERERVGAGGAGVAGLGAGVAGVGAGLGAGLGREDRGYTPDAPAVPPPPPMATTAYGKPVALREHSAGYDAQPASYAHNGHDSYAQPGTYAARDWEFVQYDRQGMAYPSVHTPTSEHAPPPSRYATQAPQAYEPQGYETQGYELQHAQGATYTSQPVPPPGHPEQPPASYQPLDGGWRDTHAQHASWRGTCTPQDVAGFRAPDDAPGVSPGVAPGAGAGVGAGVGGGGTGARVRHSDHVGSAY